MEKFEEKIEKGDAEYHHGLIKNFLTLPEPDLKILKNEIKDSKNLIRIFVHPYFEEPQKKMSRREEKIEKMQGVIEKVLGSKSEKVPPIFVMEEEDRISRLKYLIQDIIANKVYIIPTYSGSPEPKFKPKGALKEKEFFLPAKETWEKLIKKFKNLGVEKIIIGGMYLGVSNSLYGKEKEPRLLRCVGDTINHLSRDFEVEISNLTFPDSRKKYKKVLEKGA